MKKAQGLSMNVIIIAALALLVLVILAVLVINAGSGVIEGTACEAADGRCVDADDCTGTFKRELVGKSNTCEEGTICCIDVAGN